MVHSSQGELNVDPQLWRQLHGWLFKTHTLLCCSAGCWPTVWLEDSSLESKLAFGQNQSTESSNYELLCTYSIDFWEEKPQCRTVNLFGKVPCRTLSSSLERTNYPRESQQYLVESWWDLEWASPGLSSQISSLLHALELLLLCLQNSDLSTCLSGFLHSIDRRLGTEAPSPAVMGLRVAAMGLCVTHINSHDTRCGNGQTWGNDVSAIIPPGQNHWAMNRLLNYCGPESSPIYKIMGCSIWKGVEFCFLIWEKAALLELFCFLRRDGKRLETMGPEWAPNSQLEGRYFFPVLSSLLSRGKKGKYASNQKDPELFRAQWASPSWASQVAQW